MTRLTLILFIAVAAAGIALPLLVRQGARAVLQERDETRRRQADELARFTAENGALSNSVSARKVSPPLSPEELEELLKLRSEVGALGRQTNELQKLRGENTRLRESISAEQNFQPQTVPKSSWAFAGYAMPEAALQSFFWGMSQGDKKVIVGSLTGRLREPAQGESLADVLEKEYSALMTHSEFSALLSHLSGNLTGYQILSKHLVSDDTIIFLVSLPGGSDSGEQAMTMKKIDGEWKLNESALSR